MYISLLFYSIHRGIISNSDMIFIHIIYLSKGVKTVFYCLYSSILIFIQTVTIISLPVTLLYSPIELWPLLGFCQSALEWQFMQIPVRVSEIAFLYSLTMLPTHVHMPLVSFGQFFSWIDSRIIDPGALRSDFSFSTLLSRFFDFSKLEWIKQIFGGP